MEFDGFADHGVSDVLYVADLLFDRNLYPEAAALYERVVTSPPTVSNTASQPDTTLVKSCAL